MIAATQIKQYSIKEKIEETNFAIIYKVIDNDKAVRALKIARTSARQDNEHITREFHVLSQFKHPNIVSVYDFDLTDDGRQFFTLDYIEGLPLNKHFRGYSEDFLEAIIQTAHALAIIHNHGFIHSDLKPDHILFEPKEQKTVLIDFGFAGMPDDSIIGGSIGYMAPEVLKGSGIDQRSDIYSLGVIMYETLTGEKPLDTALLNDNIPEELRRIIKRCISREPALRPTVPELYHVFTKHRPEKKAEGFPYSVALPTTGYVEIPEIAERLSRTRGTALIINGGPGAGKTRLLREVKYQYIMTGYSVLYHYALDTTPLSQHLCEFLDIDYQTVQDIEDKYQWYEFISTALIEYTRKKEVLILIDEINNLSECELDLFRFLSVGVCNTSALIIGTSIPDRRIQHLPFDIIPIRPFSIDETQQLLQKTFHVLSGTRKTTSGVAQDRMLRSFTNWLHSQTGGNALYIVEVLRTLYQHKVLYYENHQWHIRQHKVRHIQIPTSVEPLLRDLLNKLTTPETTVLRVLAIAQHPVEPGIINKALSGNNDVAIEHLRSLELVKEETLEKTRSVYIANQLLARLVSKSIPARIRTAFSRMLIKAIEHMQDETFQSTAMLAQLYARVGDRKKAVLYNQRAGEQASHRHDYETALKHYEYVLHSGVRLTSQERIEVLYATADLCQKTGNHPRAIEVYHDILKLTRRRDHKPYEGMGRVYSTMGKHENAVANLQKALVYLKNKKTNEHARILNRLAYSLMLTGRTAEAHKILQQSLTITKQLDIATLTAETMYYQSTYWWITHNIPQGIESACALLRFAEQHQDIKRIGYAANLLSMFYQEQNQMGQAEEYINRALQSFSSLQLVTPMLSAMFNKAILCFDRGDYTTAEGLYAQNLILAQKITQQDTVIHCLAALASIAEYLGKFSESLAHAKKHIALAPTDVNAVCNLASSMFKQGNTDQAITAIEGRLNGNQHPQCLSLLGLFKAWTGEYSRAHDLIDQGLAALKNQHHDIDTQREVYLTSAIALHEVGDYDRSSGQAQHVTTISMPTSRYYHIAQALLTLNSAHLNENSDSDIRQPLTHLKQAHCVYDYAYLIELHIKYHLVKGVERHLQQLINESNEAREIFQSLNASFELQRIEKIQHDFFPIIARDYAQRLISEEYIATLSKLAELISTELGNREFNQHILDLIVQATNAERGALFIKTGKGLKFIVGRNIDQSTIRDANDISKTVVAHMDSRGAVYSQDAMTDPAFNEKRSVVLHKIRSLLCIPLSVAGSIVAAIYLDSRVHTGLFGPRDKEFLTTVAKILAAVIEKSIIFQEVTEENILLKTRIIEDIGSGFLIGKSPSMRKVYRLINNVARTNSPVLLMGETGTGKGMLARLIHLRSPRKDKKFVTINCGTIPETLLESELFGYKKGAFTGANTDKIGLLEEAHCGTVFLDEITNTGPSFQAKLLEAIEDKVIRRIGETTTRLIDVRFLFATNKDLEIEVEEDRFRKDLFYRINIFSIEVPPLRDRVTDIPLLARHFLKRFAHQMNKQLTGFSSKAMQALKLYYWPGNVRELQNIIERATVLAKGQVLAEYDLGFSRLKGIDMVSIHDIKKDAIIEALNTSGGNVTKASELLGINRKTIQRYIKKYKIQ